MTVNDDCRHDSNKEYRRKRVKRIKHFIVGTAFFLLIIPTICCILMMLKVHKLEQRVDALVKMHEEEYLAEQEKQKNQEEEKKTSKEDTSIVHAAEVTDPENQTVMTEVEEEAKKLTPEEILEQNTESKKVYLTFDDGPSQYSNELLDNLKEYNVKATFFVIGRTDEASKKIYKRIVEEGHTLAMHSYTHRYEEIYKSLNSFKKDVKSLSDLLYEVTGERPKYYRFPGGSSNKVSNVPIEKCISYLNEEGITYFDWNTVNGDAAGKDYTAKQMTDMVMNGVHENNNSMVLMHDTVARDTTVKSLPSLIKKLQKEGYVLLPISEYTNPFQHIKADSVK